MEIVLNYKDFNVNNIHFIEPLNNIIMKKGLHINMVYKKIEYTLNEILLETPIMEAPFGIRKYDESDNKNKNKFYLDLSFKGYDEEQSEIKVFYEKIKQLDEYIVNKSKLFSNKWQLSGKKIEDLYINQIRYNYKDNLNKYPPTFKIKMSKNNSGLFTTKLYGENKDVDILENIIKSGSKLQVVIKCNGIWSIKNRFGITWKVRYIKLIPEIEKNLKTDINDDCYLICDFEEDEKYIDFDMEDYYIYMS
tara:strand:+ start:1001 stop:1747 length:747 start_codon:yes stop_codon:yes gene_type:complete